MKVLVVHNDQAFRDNLHHVLASEGCEILFARTGADALELLAAEKISLVLTRLSSHNEEDLARLQQAILKHPDTELLILASQATISADPTPPAEPCQYLVKPFRPDALAAVLGKTLRQHRLKKENLQIKERLARLQGGTILTEDPGMRKLLGDARQVAQSDCSVLLTGERGTGKALLARFIHDNSLRAQAPLRAVHCELFKEKALACELFGHQEGGRRKRGLVEQAEGGTVFLEGITQMPLSLQVKLLRALQENEIVPVGATAPVNINVRLLAATEHDIFKMTETGAFRRDLYFRLNVMTLCLPPLADRQGDIALLTQHFIEKYSTIMGKPVRGISAEALGLLEAYPFPGNIRELADIIERAVALAQGERIEKAHLPGIKIQSRRPPRQGEMPSLDEHERGYIQWVLGQTGGNKTRAAEILGIDRVSLWRKLKRYALL